MQYFSYRHILAINSCADTFIADPRMNMISEIEYSCSFGKFEQITFRGENKHFIFIQIHFELVHQLQVIVCLECTAYVVQPFIQSGFPFYAFVSPMCGKSTLSYFVHTFSTNLYFHPFVLRSKHSYMQTFISVGFRNRKPVAKSFGVWHVHISD